MDKRSILNLFIVPGLSLLPRPMDSPEARAFLMTIGLQESRFKYRLQSGGGPARGFWQFERGGGVKHVLTHPASRQFAIQACDMLCIPPKETDCYMAIAYNDVLACIFARLNLWTIPDKLPSKNDAEDAWRQYLKVWRPGKPHRKTWDEFYTYAWEQVEGMTK